MSDLHERPDVAGEMGSREMVRSIEATLNGLSIHFIPASGIRTNAEIASWGLQTGTGKPLDEQQIVKVTGVEHRSIAIPGESIHSMAMKAIEPLADSKIVALEAVTSHPSRDGLLDGKNLSRTLVTELELPNTWDVNDFHFACSGSTEAIGYIGKQARLLKGESVAIVASELYTPTLADPKKGQSDPSHAYTIFADGAAAMRFRVGKDLSILGSRTVSFDPQKAKAIRMQIRTDLIRNPATILPVPPLADHRFNPKGEMEFLEPFFMDGPAVYEEMTKLGTIIGDFIEELKREGIVDEKQIASITPHQASSGVLHGMRRRLPEEFRDRFYIKMTDGNFSSASIIKALGEQIVSGSVKHGDVVVLVGFGAGLYASLQAIKLGE